ncbi:serine carboxypeptidase domain-containing protein [Ditylenchus destructor]|uniref:Carboxypeptidase n=1 Tax=Ditylenchus destructor TaxID=166010 RepID=A0AAD4N794_9BILA|nr:serine carboxypeptidase domain-containing protein [Ditylenchus destructor]
MQIAVKCVEEYVLDIVMGTIRLLTFLYENNADIIVKVVRRIHCNSHSSTKHSEEDVIRSLPGLSFDINFGHYSGYLNVSSSRRLHYWFVESQQNPANDPVFFWFNGGPYCSSLFGLLGELGPYLINADGETLHKNPNSWNKFANIVFLESPVGTGFSYSIDGNYTNSDDQSADEAYEAIKQFLKKFPKFRKHEIFLTGESYAGVFIPVLSAKVLRSQEDFHINFKGVVIGNGLLAYDDNMVNYPYHSTVINYVYSHGLLDEELWQYLKNKCCDGCAENCDFLKLQGECGARVKEWPELINKLPNAYNIYSKCKTQAFFIKDSDSAAARAHSATPSFHGDINEECLPESGLHSYLGKLNVRKALHIPNEVESWVQCRERSGYTFQYFNMSKFINEIVNANVPVLLYYGDADLVCNFIMGEKFSANLGLKQTSPKQIWKHDGFAAGTKTDYGSHLTYMTVLGAGHMVPHDKAPEIYQVIKKFISGKTNILKI